MRGNLTFHQPLNAATRIFVGLCGLLTFYAPYDLLIRPGVPAFTLGMIPLWAISLAAVGIGIPVLVACILGLNRTVVISPAIRTVTVLGAGSFGLRFRADHAFEVLGEVFAERDHDSEGALPWEVAIRRPNPKRPLLIARVATEAQAQATVAEIAAALARP